MIDLIINNGLSLGTFAHMSILMIPSVVALILPIGVFCAVLFAVSRRSWSCGPPVSADGKSPVRCCYWR
jgi:hypothetical protein